MEERFEQLKGVRHDIGVDASGLATEEDCPPSIKQPLEELPIADDVIDLRQGWGTAAGYFTGDPSLLAARGLTSSQIQQVQKGIQEQGE